MNIFEFSSTCEEIRQNDLIQQPYAFILNIVTICVVIGLLVIYWRRADWKARCVALSVVFFESWHALCHARPLFLSKPETMVDITHSLFLVSMVLLACFVSGRLSSDRHKMYFWTVVAVLFLIDAVTWGYFIRNGVRKTGMIFSGLAIAIYLTLIFIIIHYRKLCTSHMYPLIQAILTFSFVGAFIMLYYEKTWCTQSRFPLHVVTESILLIIVVCTVYLFLSTA